MLAQGCRRGWVQGRRAELGQGADHPHHSGFGMFQVGYQVVGLDLRVVVKLFHEAYRARGYALLFQNFQPLLGARLAEPLFGPPGQLLAEFGGLGRGGVVARVEADVLQAKDFQQAAAQGVGQATHGNGAGGGLIDPVVDVTRGLGVVRLVDVEDFLVGAAGGAETLQGFQRLLARLTVQGLHLAEPHSH